MMTWPVWLCRLLPYLGLRQADADVEQELRLHLELKRERQREAGAQDSDARRAARRIPGNAALIREPTRDIWSWRWLDDLGRDLRHAARGLGRSPGFAATVVLLLALGIGANTAMFSIAYGLLLRPLPYPDPAAIVRVGYRSATRPGSIGWLTNSTLPRLQQEATSFEHVAGYAPRNVVWNGPDGPVTLRGAMVSPSLFPLLRATPRLGRLLAAEEAREGASRVALLSHRAWTNRFASDPDIAGAPIELDGEPYTVAGVLAEGFAFPSPEEEVWTPMVMWSSDPVPDAEGRILTISFAFSALGRLRRGVSPEQAAAEVETLLRPPDTGDGRTGEDRPPDRSRDFVARVVPLQEEMMREHRPALQVLSAGAVLVLLIACVNVAGLLLARGIARQRELAVRGALGAGRGRIARELLTESVVLGAGGGALGLVTAAAVLRAVPALAPPDLSRLHAVDVDGVVFAFTALLSVLAGLAVGAVPAFQWSRLPLVRILNEGNARAAGGFPLLRANRARAVLATVQVALALVLLIGAGLLLRSFVQLVSVDPGYDPANVLTARVGNPGIDNPFLAGPMTIEAMAERRASSRRFYAALLDRLTEMERLTAIEAVGVSSGIPFGGGRGVARLRVAGRPEPADGAEVPEVWVQTVSAGYFRTLRLRLLSGRALTRLDAAGAPRVVVVNETLVREHLDRAPAVGQRLLFGRDDEPWTVVGVVADVEYQDLAATQSRGEIHVSVSQSETASVLNLNDPFVSVRASGDPVASLPFLREAVADVHPRAPLDDVMTMDARLSAAVAQPRVYSLFVAFFAALALFVAAAGLYGLLSRTVSERQREIGVRMALGARRYDVLALVVRQGAGLIAVGTVLGLPVAAASARFLESLLFGVSAVDPLTFLAAPLVLAAVALVACWLPGRRAVRLHPMDALRAE